jgi:hypothetical protein
MMIHQRYEFEEFFSPMAACMVEKFNLSLFFPVRVQDAV